MVGSIEKYTGHIFLGIFHETQHSGRNDLLHFLGGHRAL